MKTFQNKFTNFLSGSLLVLCCAAWLLFGWSASGWKALAVPTGSMQPAIPSGSMVFVRRVPASNLKVGDVITYDNPLRPGTTLSHRIVKTYLISGKVPGFVTKGDANKIEDAPIAAGNVVGKVEWHIPNTGRWLMDSKKPFVVLPIVYIAAILIMTEEILRLRDYFRWITPYRVPGFSRHIPQPSVLKRRLSFGAAVVIAFIIGASIGPVSALSNGGSAILTGNKISVQGSAKCNNRISRKSHFEDRHHRHDGRRHGGWDEY